MAAPTEHRRRAILDGIDPRLLSTALVALLCILLLAACGGADPGASEPAARSTPRPAAPPPQREPGTERSLALPGSVPLRDSGPGDLAAIRVIRRWSDALRRSDIERASALWAAPSKVQNGTPVLTLGSPATVRLFNDSLSCGSLLVSALGARDGFTIAIFKLTRRPGADCGTGTGQRARTAIRVREGKIAEWYRLPDDPNAPAPAQPAVPQEPPGPIV